MAQGPAETAAIVKVVRGAGLEPAQYCYRQDLNLKFPTAYLLFFPMKRRKIDLISWHFPNFFPNSTKIVKRFDFSRGQLTILT